MLAPFPKKIRFLSDQAEIRLTALIMSDLSSQTEKGTSSEKYDFGHNHYNRRPTTTGNRDIARNRSRTNHRGYGYRNRSRIPDPRGKNIKESIAMAITPLIEKIHPNNTAICRENGTHPHVCIMCMPLCTFALWCVSAHTEPDHGWVQSW